MGKREFSGAALANMIHTEADAYRSLETLRWTDGTPDCCPRPGYNRGFGVCESPCATSDANDQALTNEIVDRVTNLLPSQVVPAAWSRRAGRSQ